MRKILCPTDFSDTAQNAITYAAKFCQATGSDLLLFNVQPMRTAYAEAASQKTIADVHTDLEAQSIEISKTFKISCCSEVDVSVNSLPKMIIEKASGHDLIIMGTNGADDLAQMITGSHTYNVIRNVRIPILMIPHEVMYNKIERICLASDYLRERTLPIKQLAALLNNLQSNVFVLQVLEEARSEEMEADLAELQFILKNRHAAEMDLRFETLRSANIPECIDHYICENKIDLLALRGQDYGLLSGLFHKSVIKRLGTRAGYPIMIVYE